MSISITSATTDGNTITVEYSYDRQPTGVTFQLTVNTVVVASGYEVLSLSFTKTTYKQFFTQGIRLVMGVIDDQGGRSDNSYYIYMLTNNISNRYMQGETNKQINICATDSTDRSVVLPRASLVEGVIYHFKAGIIGTNTSFFLVPTVTGVTYPITADSLLQTNDSFSAFESNIDGANERLAIASTRYAYSLIALNGNWRILNYYTSLFDYQSIELPGTYTSLSANSTVAYYNWQTSSQQKNNILLPTLTKNTLYYLTIVNNLGNQDGITIYLPTGWIFDTYIPPASSNAYIAFLLTSLETRSLIFIYEPQNTSIRVLGYYNGSNIEETTRTTDYTQITKGITLFNTESMQARIPPSLQETNYSKIYYIKKMFTGSAKLQSIASGNLQIFLSGTGYVNEIQATEATTTKHAFWVLVFYDGSGTKAFIINKYPGVP